MRRFYLAVAFFIACSIPFTVTSQVTTSATSGLAPSYASLTAAINDLNSIGTVTDNVVITLGADQTAPAGGYVITATGTSSFSITIDGAGFVVTAGTQTAGSTNDAVFKIVGGDYITFQYFIITENAANTVLTPVASNTMTEFGIALYAANTTNGAKNNNIIGNNISLNGSYTQSIGILSTSTFVSATTTLGAAPVAQTSVAGGENSNNRYQSNFISSVAYGIMLAAPPAIAGFRETGNIVGGPAAFEGNTIIYGNNTVIGVNYPGCETLATELGGITITNSIDVSVEYNDISGTGNFNIATAGVSIGFTTSAPAGAGYTNTVSNNIINLVTVATGNSSPVFGIDFAYGITGFAGNNTAGNNTITIAQTLSAAVATSYNVAGIRSINSTGGTYTFNNNNITFNQSQSASAIVSSNLFGIWASAGGITINSISIAGNTITYNQTTATATSITSPVAGVNIGGALSTITTAAVNNNTVTIKQSVTGAGSFGSPAPGTSFIAVAGTSGNLCNYTTLSINNNNLTTTGSTFRTQNIVYGINHDFTNVAALTISGNNINIDRTQTGLINAIHASAYTSTAANTSNITNNTVTIGGTMGPGGPTVIGINELEGRVNMVKNITGNTVVINLPGLTLGPQTGISYQTGAAAGTSTNTGDISNNSLTLSTGGAIVTGIQVLSPGIGIITNISNNNFTLSSTQASPTVRGIYINGGSRSNIFSNNFISLGAPNSTSTPTITGIELASGSTAANPHNVYSNTISNFSTFAGSGAGSVRGIWVAGVTANIYRNKIYGLSCATTNASSRVMGILYNGVTNSTSSIYNNIIGFDNSACPNANAADAVQGINMTAALSNNVLNVAFNTIYLAAVPSASVTNYGTSGITSVGDANAANGKLNLVSNIIVNKSTQKGTGLTVALRRITNASLANYGTAAVVNPNCDNNLLYAGSPSATNYILYFDGATNDQTINAFRTRVGPNRDAASVTEDPVFASLTGSNANYLKFTAGTPTLVEAGGKTFNLPFAITDDYDGDTRCPGVGCPGSAGAPDIGADEFAGTCIPPSVLPTGYAVGAYGVPTAGAYTGTFTAAVPAPTGGYLVVRTPTNTQPVPVNGTTYIVGNPIGAGTVVGVGTATNFTNVVAAGTYYYWLFAYNGCSGSPSYSTTALVYATAACAAPTAQPTAMVVNPLSTTSIGGSFTPVPAGGASGYLVVRTSVNSAPDVNPVNGTTYVIGNTFGATVIGTVVGAGSGNTFTASGLTPNTQYWFWVYAYNNLCYAPLPAYNVTTPLTGTATTFPCVQPLPAINTVGPTATYPTITAAIANLVSCSPLAASANYVFELQPDYVSTSETFPVTLPSTITGTYTSIIFRPSLTATGLVLTSNNTAGTLLFQGAPRISFDGRQAGTGSRELTIQNTNLGSSYAIQFENGANTDTIRHCNIRSVHNGTSGGGGTINFAQAGAAANANIVIENNNIFEAAGGTPTCAVYSNGSASPLQNNGIRIQNNSIYNFFNAAYPTAGINLAANSINFTISGNSFYQTASRSFTNIIGTFSAVISGAVTNTGLTISNNFIGGTAANTGGTPMIIAGNGILRGMQLLTGTVASSVQGNVINNITYTSSNPSSTHSLIYYTGGNVNLGTITGNRLGSLLGTDSIKVILSDNTTGVAFSAINSSSTISGDIFNVRNNTIGSIAVSGTSTAATVQGINISGATGTNTVVGNTIGSASTGNSFNTTLNTTITGIFGNSANTAATQVISGNTIVNVSALSTGTSSYATGIYVGNSGVYTVGDVANGGNTIYNVSSAGSNSINFNTAGIVNFTSSGNQSIQGNTLYNIHSNSNSDVGVVGIYYASSATAGTNNIERNLIYSLELSSTITNSQMVGIQLDGTGTTNVQNNMIRLGTNGVALNTGYIMYGIADNLGTNRFYFNSIYLGGSGIGTGNDTYCFNSANTGTKDIRNNIFWNARANASASTPNHYAVVLSDNTGTIDYNDLLATGTGRMLGFYGTQQLTLAAWRTATARDANSYSANPGFVNPTAVTPDLHINAASPTVIEAGGVAIASPTNDFDNQARVGLSPVDLGADAVNAVAPSRLDLSIIDMPSPILSFGCYSNNENITVTLRNNTATAIDFVATPVTLTVVIGGPVSNTLTLTINSGLPLAGNSTSNVTVGTQNMTILGTYTFNCTFAVATPGIDSDNTNNEYNTTRAAGVLGIGTATSSPQGFCGVASGTPTLSLSSVSGGVVQWYQSTVSSSGPWTAVGTSSISYSPGLINTTHHFYATVSCGAASLSSNVVTVLVSSPQVLSAAVSGSSSNCGPKPFTLTGTVNSGSVLKWYDAASGGVLLGSGSPFTTDTIRRTTTLYARAESTTGAPATANFGTGTNVNTTTGYPAPYTNWYGGTKHQMLILASELGAAGVTAGNITSVTFYVSSVGSTFSGALNSYTIHMGSTTSTAMTSTFLNGGDHVLVYSNASQAIPASGAVTHTFSTPFVWDGVSNIYIQTSYSNGNVGISSDNVQMFNTNTSFASTTYAVRDGQTPATVLALASGTALTRRPNMTLGYTAVCFSSSSSPVTVTINPVPTDITVNPAAPSICPGVPGSDSTRLIATGGVMQNAASISVSNNTSIAIPDNNATGVSSTINVAGIPVGSTIDSIRVNVNLAHTWISDAMLTLQSPNGQVVNLVSNRGGSADNFTNTVISSNAANQSFASGTAPFSSLFRADGATTVCGTGAGCLQITPSVMPTTSSFSALGTGITGNGNWILRAYDDEAAISGTLNNWTITIYYKEPVTSATYLWTPAAGLFTDAGLLSAYTNQNITTVYAKPAATTTYTISATFGPCSSDTTVVVTVNTLSTSASSLTATPSTSCSGGNVTLTQTGGVLGTGATWRWYSDAAFTTLVGSSVAANAALVVTPVANTTYYLRAEGGTAPCSGTVATGSSVAVTINPNGTWLGIDNNWNNASNWCGGVPTSATDVTIPTSTNYPNISGITAAANNITITGSGTLTVAATGTLQVAGSITAADNTINATAGTVEFVGSAAQTIRANHFVSATLANLTVSNTNTVTGLSIDNTGAMLNVSGAVSFGNVNNGRLTTNDKLTLLSSAAATARIADITNAGANTGNDVTGKVVIERFVPAKRAWRLLASPIRASTLPVPNIFNQWQESATSAPLGTLADPNPGFGTHISKGIPALGSFDQNNTGNSSIFYLTPTGWNGSPTTTNGNVSGTNTGVITDHPGYLVFVRGNRSTNLALGQFAPATTTILRNNGLINTTPNDGVPSVVAGAGNYFDGTFTYNIWSNPYPSAINYHSLATSAGNNGVIPDAFYLWDANVTGNNGVGGWVSLIWNSGLSQYDRTIVSGSGSTGLNGTGDIQSGSAFMIRYSGNISFRERNKVSGSNNTILRPVAGRVHQLRTNLLAKNADGTISVNDGILVTFDQANNNGFDDNDMPKMLTFAENMGIRHASGYQLAIERRQPAGEADTIHLQLSRMRTKDYQLEFALESIDAAPGVIAELEDTYLNKKQVLMMDDTTRYNFSATVNTASAAADRFRIVFRKLIQFTRLQVEVVNTDIAVNWNVGMESGIAGYEVQRSLNGTSFETMGYQACAGDSKDGKAYSWLDLAPEAGTYFYRIRCLGTNGAVSYSEVAKVTIRKATPKMYVFPNPVTNSIIGLQLNGLPAGVYETRLFDAAGKVVNYERIAHASGTATIQIRPKNTLVSGLYQLEVIGPDKQRTVLKVAVKTE